MFAQFILCQSEVALKGKERKEKNKKGIEIRPRLFMMKVGYTNVLFLFLTFLISCGRYIFLQAIQELM
jgi:hypothetical protein